MKSVLERAYELARTGDYATPTAIRVQLSAEGYINTNGHFAGTTLLKQLRKLCSESRAAKPALAGSHDTVFDYTKRR